MGRAMGQHYVNGNPGETREETRKQSVENSVDVVEEVRERRG